MGRGLKVTVRRWAAARSETVRGPAGAMFARWVESKRLAKLKQPMQAWDALYAQFLAEPAR